MRRAPATAPTSWSPIIIAAQFHWDEQRVNAELECKMVAAWEAVFREHQATKVPMRIAAYAVALKRLAEATKMRF